MQQLSMLSAAMEHVLLSIYCTTIVKLLYAYYERQLAIFIICNSSNRDLPATQIGT